MASFQRVEDEDNAILAKLKELSLDAATYSHPLAFTVEEQAVHVGGIPGTLTKNLFLRDKKYGLFLVTTRASCDVNMKTLGAHLKLSGSNLRFGDEDILSEKLGVIRGAVSPFALLNDKNNEVKFCIDQSLLNEEIINIHPLRNDRTTSISPANLLKFLDNIDHKPTVIDFSVAPAAASGNEEKPKKSNSVNSTASGGANESSNERELKKETLLGISAKKSEDFD